MILKEKKSETSINQSTIKGSSVIKSPNLVRYFRYRTTLFTYSLCMYNITSVETSPDISPMVECMTCKHQVLGHFIVGVMVRQTAGHLKLRIVRSLN